MSHATCYNHILRMDEAGLDELFLVLEDDAEFTPGWKDAFNEALPHVPQDWDLLRIGYWGLLHQADRINDYVYAASQPNWEALDWGFHNMGTHAIVVRRRTLQRVLDHLNRQTVVDDLDITITAYDRGLKSYILAKQLVTCPYNGGLSPMNPAGMYGLIESYRSS